MNSFYTYLVEALIGNAYGKLEDTVEREFYHEYTLYMPDVLWLSNQVSILVGVIRLRQQRVGDGESFYTLARRCRTNQLKNMKV